MTEPTHAQLDWDADGQPLSRSFGDVYFSRASGLEETRHVFLQHNQLAERFSALGPGEALVIGETGFGTGLNFLCAWQLFEQCAPAGASLHFVSVEKYPLTHVDLERALALWPELAAFSSQLLVQYVAIHPGFQRILLDGGRVILTLLIGDVLELLPQLDAQVDAWFLDGFAPAKNPQMWNEQLFSQLARLSAADATLATFTCAGFVRRGLIDAGFAMQKVKGFGHKREMLAGRYLGQPAESPQPWYARPPQIDGQRTALVIGGGLAGCSTAASLAARGWEVTLIERAEALATAASGNPQGVLYLKLSAHHTALSQLIVAGFGLTRRLLTQLPEGEDWSPCGVLQLAFDDKELQRQHKLGYAFPPDLLRCVDAAEASALSGITLQQGGLWYSEAGWAHPPAVCRHLARHPRIRIQTSQHACRLQQVDGQWQVFAGEQLLASASQVVLCNAADVLQFAAAAHLPLKSIRGQITRVPATSSSRALHTVLCAEGYVAPARQNEHTLGASFNFQRQDLVQSEDEHRSNLQLLDEISPALAARLQASALDPASLQGRVGLRATTPDYLPLVGPLVDSTQFRQQYAALGKDARLQFAGTAPWLTGLHVNCGHGSRGLVTAALSGELLAAWLSAEPLPVPRSVAEACHPSRFLLRDLIRGKA